MQTRQNNIIFCISTIIWTDPSLLRIPPDCIPYTCSVISLTHPVLPCALQDLHIPESLPFAPSWTHSLTGCAWTSWHLIYFLPQTFNSCQSPSTYYNAKSAPQIILLLLQKDHSPLSWISFLVHSWFSRFFSDGHPIHINSFEPWILEAIKGTHSYHFVAVWGLAKWIKRQSWNR